MKLLPLIVVLSTVACSSQNRGSQLQETADYGNGQSAAFVPPDKFSTAADPDHLGKQRQTDWCWAAVSQMILNFHGVTVTQEQIVQQTLGSLANEPISIDTLVSGLNGWKVEGHAVVTTASRIPLETDLIDALTADQPIAVALHWPDNPGTGHFWVLMAADFHQNADGTKTLEDVWLVDPLPQDPTWNKVSAQEFHARIFGAVKIEVAAPNSGSAPHPTDPWVATSSPASAPQPSDPWLAASKPASASQTSDPWTSTIP